MSTTPRLGLPLLAPGQSQKELFHNESLQLLDIIAAAAVEEPPRADPPSSPAVGTCYIVAAAPTGAWAGHSQSLACFTSGGWRFLPPFDGLAALVRSEGSTATYRGGAWDVGTVFGSKLVVAGHQVVGSQAAAISSPSGGSTVDEQARAAISQILAVLRGHGLIAT